MITFGTWWVILMATENKRREMAGKSLKAAYMFEWGRIDEEYTDRA